MKWWTVTLVVKVDIAAEDMFEATHLAKQFDWSQSLSCIPYNLSDITFVKVRPTDIADKE